MTENNNKTIEELRREALRFYPAIFLDKFFGFSSHSLYSFVLNILSVVSGFLSLFFLSSKLNSNVFFSEKFISDIEHWEPIVFGTFLLCLAFQLMILALKAFYHSYAFLDLVNEDGKENDMQMTFESASIFYRNSSTLAVEAFLYSKTGLVTLSRLGLNFSEVVDFYSKSVSKITLNSLSIKSDSQKIRFENFSRGLIEADKDFVIFLSSRGVTKEDFVGASLWAENMLLNLRKRGRWWSKDRLGRIPGIGKDWAYADVPTLSKYASLITNSPYYNGAEDVVSIRKTEIEDLEQVLSKIKGANAVIVADTNEEALSIIGGLGYMIEKGLVFPNLEHKLIYVLDYTNIISSSKEKTVFEAHFRSALNETLRAGNIILVLKDLPGLISSAKEIGSDMIALLSWYFNAPQVHIIGTASVSSFHATMENNDAIMRNFERVLMKSVGLGPVLKYLEDEALRIESQTGVYFLYQALRASAESAERFFFGSSVEGKADDLLVEVASLNSSKGKTIGREDIMKVVEQKTGVPTNIAEDKKNISILLNLENLLLERVIGQEEAVRSVASAIRRSHSGVGNPNRPMGSFLFLGPTGVGKTETTKALADAFFGGEGAIMRLDMSEYKTIDALERLIGNFAIGKPGVLTSMLRDKPYGVLLLDEFEKTSKDVMDLFLQILDEGIFSDMSGRKVNARNLIIIATSNAGSEMIWKIVKEKGENAINKDEIISYIVNQGIFKPELINRFDGAIIFKPLTRVYLAKIAELMMKKLNKRLVEKGLEVLITPELINALVERGTDPTFGARPMNRAIQDKIETMVADKILRGEAPAGTKIVFGSEDLIKVRN